MANFGSVPGQINTQPGRLEPGKIWQAAASGDTSTTAQRAALGLYDPQQDRDTSQRWFAPDAEQRGSPAIASAYDPSLRTWQEPLAPDQLLSTAQRWFAPDAEHALGIPPFAVTTATAAQSAAATEPDDTPQVWRDGTPWAGRDLVGEALQPPAAAFNPAPFAGTWQEQPQAWQDATPWASRVDDDDDDGFVALPNAYAGADLAWYLQVWRDSTPWAPRTDDQAEGFVPLPNASTFDPGWDAQQSVDRTARWFQPDTEAQVAIPNLTVATVDQASPALQPDAEQRDLSQRWYQEPDDQLGALPITTAPATVDQQSPALQPEADQPDRTQRWFQPDTETLGAPPLPNAPTEATLDEQPQAWSNTWTTEHDGAFVPTVSTLTTDQLAGLWTEQPGQDRSLQPVWTQPEDDATGLVPLASANVLPLDWDAQQDRSTQPTWFQPDTEPWTPVPGLTSATIPQLAALWPDSSGQQDRSIQPVWFGPEPTFASPYGQLIVVIVTGGRGPDSGGAYNTRPSGSGFAPVPGAGASGPVPSGSAVNPRPSR